MLIDSHCHINSEELRLDARAVITRAWDAGVRRMVIVGCNFEDSCEALALAEDFSQFGLYASIGIHPHEAKRYDSVPEEFGRLINSGRTIAYGEIGLDYHYDNSPRDIQQKIFEKQLEFAAEHDKPVILHIREAMNDAMNILMYYRGLKMMFHCYSGGLEYLDAVMNLNSVCSFGGALTWTSKSSDALREVFRRVPADRILMETDSPYMSPMPFRGKKNEPAYVRYVYDTAASERGMTFEAFKSQVEQNAKNFFGWE